MTMGVSVRVNAGTPIAVVASSMVGVPDGACEGAIRVMVVVTGSGVERPVRAIAHVPKPVSETMTESRMMMNDPVSDIPPGDVG